MNTAIGALHLWEAGAHDAAILMWTGIPRAERQAAITADWSRCIALQSEALTRQTIIKCEVDLDRFEGGGVEPDDICNRGVWAEGIADRLDRWGSCAHADRVREAAIPLLKAAVMY